MNSILSAMVCRSSRRSGPARPACALTVVLETWQEFVNRSADLADVLLAFVTVPPLWYRTTQPDAAVDASRSGDALLNDVRVILEARNTRGVPNFSYLPRRRPPDLARMLIAKASDPAVDSYNFGDGPVYAYVEYSHRRPTACTAEPEPGSSEYCVQDREIHPTGASATYSFVSVRLGMSTGATPDLTNLATRAAATYWATTDLVPTSEADWFSDLANRAQVSAPTR